MKPGINCQDGALAPSDAADLARFGSVLVIAAWEPPMPTLTVLKTAGVGVGMFRFCQDPHNWTGWPHAYVALCPRMVAANEPDIEGSVPDWYGPVCDAWKAAGGQVGEPAWSDEAKRAGVQRAYEFITCHLYPRGNGAANLAACRARANGRPLIVTEAGDATNPAGILVELAAMGVTETVYLYTYRALNEGAAPAYNLAGIALQSPGIAPTGGGTGGRAVLTGIDVSSLQPDTDWARVAASGHAFAAIKATEGTGYVNPYFARDWADAKAAGLVRIAYHYARPDAGNPPENEADYFLRVAGPLAPGDLFALDLEEGSGALAGWALAFLQHVAGQLPGCRPLLYTYPSFIPEHGLATPALADYPLWYASYQPDMPDAPAPWQRITIWQHSDNATVDGVIGIVDEDVTTLGADELRALGYQGGHMVDSLTVLALSRAKAANPAIAPDVNSANFKAYREMIAAWDAAGRPNYLDPSPWLRNEAATATDAYVPLDNGLVLHAKVVNGEWTVFLAEEQERRAIFAAVGWGQAA